MVRVLPDPASPAGTPTHENPDAWSPLSPASLSISGDANRIMTREEHAQKVRALNMRRGVIKNPRRGWSMSEGSSSPHGQEQHHYQQTNREPPIPENGPMSPALESPTPSSPFTPTSAISPSLAISQQQQFPQVPRRPKLPTPRRSYTVMDYEPSLPPGAPGLSSRLTILDLPPELHLHIIDLLDPIDSTCLGLAHSRLYTLHRRKHGTVSLSAHYDGPNRLEWVWRGAGLLIDRREEWRKNALSMPEAAREEARRRQAVVEAARPLAQLRLKGQMYCRKCATRRCELHRHLRDWMPQDLEYCSTQRKFVSPPPVEGKDTKCYKAVPTNPRICGRHRPKGGLIVPEGRAETVSAPVTPVQTPMTEVPTPLSEVQSPLSEVQTPVSEMQRQLAMVMV